MRRSANSRGRGRGRGSSRPAGQRPEGPFYNDNIRDLDIELDMLRRQREIIQQKQALLNQESEFTLKRQNSFNEPCSSFNYVAPKQRQFNNSATDFSLLYNSSNSNRQNAAKRNSNNWQDSTPPKRSNTQTVINPWATPGSSQNTHMPFQPFTSYKSDTGKKAFLKPRTKPRTDFKPSKITKPKAQVIPIPNKLQTYPAKEAKKLVSATVGTVATVATAAKASKVKVFDHQILRPDEPPTVQMTGRMELALGQIIKDLKKKHSHDANLIKILQLHNIERLLKTTVRSRITDMMMNKVVGHFSTIIESYRQKYPEETHDEELIDIAKKAYDTKTKLNPETDEQRMAIKAEVLNVLENKLTELFGELSKLGKNKGKEEEILKRIDELPDLEKPKKSADTTADDDVIIINEEDRETEKKNDYLQLIGEMVEYQLPRLLPKYKFTIIKLLTDRGIKAFLYSVFINMFKKTLQNKNNSIQEDSQKDDSTQNASLDKTMQKDVITPNEDATVKKVDLQISKPNAEQRAPQQTATNVTPQKTPANVTPLKTPGKALLPYYVKLFGRPNIPPKAVIYEFLNKFNPASIKKHKSVNNLLVIGFTNIEDFKSIVAANETVVGNATLFIKASEKVGESKGNDQANENKETTLQNKIDSSSSNNENTSEPGGENSNLNKEINNLLTTIREATEKDTAEGEEAQIEGETAAQGTNNESANVKNELSEKDPNVGEEEIQRNNDNNVIEDTTQNTNEMNENEDKSNLNKGINNLLTTIREATEKDTAEGEEAQIEGETAAQGTNNKSGNVKNELSENDPNVGEEEIQRNNDNNVIEDVTQNTNEMNENEDKSKTDDTNKDLQNKAESNEIEMKEEVDNKSVLNNLKESGRATPTRSSSRLANVTPSTIKTRRASKLAQ